MLAWTLAGVIAEEYPSKWIQVSVYSIASGVSVTRVLGQEHFPTDVLVGAAAGWLIGTMYLKSTTYTVRLALCKQSWEDEWHSTRAAHDSDYWGRPSHEYCHATEMF